MNRIQSILMVSAAAFSVNVAFAQTPDAQNGAPAGAAPEARIVTSTTDPLVQKRKDNALANQQYKENKKSAKEDYQHRVKAAKMDRKQFKKDATTQEKAAMAGETTAAPLEAVPNK